MTIGCHQGRTSIKPDFGVGGHKGVCCKPFISQRIRNNKNAVGLQDRMSAERNIPRGFHYRQTHLRLEPLPVCINEGYERNGGFAYMRSQSSKVVKCLFGSSIEDFILAKGFEPRRFIGREGGVFPFCVPPFRVLLAFSPAKTSPLGGLFSASAVCLR